MVMSSRAPPYLNGSNEDVELTLAAPADVFVMVHGYENAGSDGSPFLLSGASIGE
jgi:hypothetical protein